MKITLALTFWILMLVVAIANGYLNNIYVESKFWAYTGHFYKSAELIIIIFLLARIYAGQIKGIGWMSSIKTGLLWCGQTVIFELLFGHYVIGASWEILLSDYKI